MNTFLALVYVAYSHIRKNNSVAQISDDSSIDKEMTEKAEDIVVDDMERQREG